MFGEGLKHFFRTIPDFRVVCQERTGDGFFGTLASQPADIALVNANLPDVNNCADIVQRLRKDYPATIIFAMANEGTGAIVQKMMKAGMNGYIGKREAKLATLENLMRKVATGERYIGSVEPTYESC